MVAMTADVKVGMTVERMVRSLERQMVALRDYRKDDVMVVKRVSLMADRLEYMMAEMKVKNLAEK